MSKVKDAPGMKGIRSRNPHGPLRAKRGDTLLKTIEKQYGIEFKDARKDMRLDNYLKKHNKKSLNDLFEK
ncbi:MAG: hypothetical protein ACOYS2_02820 [Patescibacteria group bacterium]